MSNDFSTIFNELREKAGFKNVSQLAQVSGVSQATLSRLQSGRGQPSPETLRKLSPHLNVSYQELMRLAGHLEDDDLFEDIDWDLPEDNPISVVAMKNYNIVTKTGIFVGLEYLPPKYRGDYHVYIQALDNSMSLAGINKGDLILIRLDVPVDNGDIVAVSIMDNTVEVKRYFRHLDKVILFNECRDGQSIECNVADVKILGKAVRVVSSLE